MKIKVKKLCKKAETPKYALPGDAGFDLKCLEDVRIPGSGCVAVGTGLSFEIPEGYELQIRPRSGLSLSSDIRIANSPGTIDSGYRGEVKVLVWNTGPTSYYPGKGVKMAQGVICPIIKASFEEIDDLKPSSRGTSGFGSTGET